MELNQTAIEMEFSGILSEEEFGISDMGMLFEILRHKMYSNSIAAICREVTCNARDAHREAGTPDRPIEITIPNKFDPHYRVRDYGPGIDPQRMKAVFILYAASTKRNDNMQTGGFGLGAKTPFSYSNRFNIVTVTGGMKRTYTAVIDESRKGKLLLNAEVPSSEPNSTEIIVPVETKDFNDFRTYTHESTRHWSVKPIIHGAIIDYRDYTQIVMQGDGWFVVNAQSGYYGGRQIKVLVDEIEYPFDISSINASRYDSIFNGRYVIYLKFGVGTLSLAANREQLDADERTRHAIEDALEKIRNVLVSTAQQTLDKAETFREANLAYYQLVSSMGSNNLVADLKWKDQKLFGNEVYVEGAAIDEYTVYTGTTPVSASSNGRRGRSGRVLRFDKAYMLIVNDLGDFKVTDKHMSTVAAAIITNPASATNPRTLQLAKFTDFEKAKEKYNLELVGYRLLSEFVKPRKVSARSYLGRMTFYKFSEGKGPNYTWRFSRSSIAEYEADTKTKVCVTLHKSPRDEAEKVAKDKKGNVIDSSQFVRLSRVMDDGVSFYGFMHDVDAKRLAESISDIKTLDDLIEEFMVKEGIVLDEMQQVAEFTQTQSSLFTRGYSERSLIERKSEITRVDSPLLEYFARLEEIQTLVNKYDKYMSIGHFMGFEGADTTNVTIEKHREKIAERYPLFTHLNGYCLNIDHVIEYINLVDAAR